MRLREHFQQVFGCDLRAAMADVLGYRVLSPDQERLVEAVEQYPCVAAMGASGCGKSFVFGAVAALVIATTPGAKALFGAGKYEQAVRLSWLELQRALRAAREQPPVNGYVLTLDGAGCGVSDWYPGGKEKNPDWFAVCTALSDRNNAANVKGILHAPRSLVVLDEIEGIAPEVRDVLWAGLTQENAHFWLSFNPVSRASVAGQFWDRTPPEARVQFSALRCAEWQARLGVQIPGMPTLEAIERQWKGKENDPLYFTHVLGEFPPPSADSVVIPQNWYDAVAECLPADADREQPVVLGIDTGGGVAENVIASVQGRVVRIEWVSRQHHRTQELVAAVKECVSRYSHCGLIVVDYVGLGGKGVADILASEGFRVMPFIGGAQEFGGHRDPTGLTGDVATWAWFTLRELVRQTVEAIEANRPERYISLPRDPVLREQVSRGFEVTNERRYRLASKQDLAVSPDRADAVAMAVLGATQVLTRDRIHIGGVYADIWA